MAQNSPLGGTRELSLSEKIDLVIGQLPENMQNASTLMDVALGGGVDFFSNLAATAETVGSTLTGTQPITGYEDGEFTYGEPTGITRSDLITGVLGDPDASARYQATKANAAALQPEYPYRQNTKDFGNAVAEKVFGGDTPSPGQEFWRDLATDSSVGQALDYIFAIPALKYGAKALRGGGTPPTPRRTGQTALTREPSTFNVIDDGVAVAGEDLAYARAKAIQAEFVGEAKLGQTAAGRKQRGTFPGRQGIANLERSGAEVMTSHGKKTGAALALQLSKAEAMAASGESREAIWDTTGMFQGTVDREWRWELDDSPSAYKEPTDLAQGFGPDAGSRIQTGQLPDFLQHPDLYATFPKAEDITTTMNERPGGTYSPRVSEGSFRRREGITADRTNADPRRFLLHEASGHAVQNREPGFGTGANPAEQRTTLSDRFRSTLGEWNSILTEHGMGAEHPLLTPDSVQFKTVEAVQQRVRDQAAFLVEKGVPPSDVDALTHGLIGPGFREGDILTKYDNYLRNSGEAEARNIEARRDMTPAERRAKPPWRTDTTSADVQWVGSERDATTMSAPPPPRTGQQNAEFFSGKAKKASSAVPYVSQLGTSRYSPETASYQKYTTDNFTGHISKMIPGFAEKQAMVAQGITRALKPGSFLDIGASEGGLAKTVGEHNPGAKVVALDPNPDMRANFDNTPAVANVDYR
ncbi:MAG: hypothetical protein DRQ39_11435, partial [Gammaproteobacteria bacterium]